MAVDLGYAHHGLLATHNIVRRRIGVRDLRHMMLELELILAAAAAADTDIGPN